MLKHLRRSNKIKIYQLRVTSTIYRHLSSTVVLAMVCPSTKSELITGNALVSRIATPPLLPGRPFFWLLCPTSRRNPDRDTSYLVFSATPCLEWTGNV